MKTMKALFTLLLSASFFAVPLFAEEKEKEWKPVIVARFAGPDKLLDTAEAWLYLSPLHSPLHPVVERDKIQHDINTLRKYTGIDGGGFFGLASGGREEVFHISDSFAILPITDYKTAGIQNPENLAFPLSVLATILFDLRKSVEENGKVRLNINPSTILQQKKGYLLLSEENMVKNIPAEPKAVFAGLEPFLAAVKFNIANMTVEDLNKHWDGHLFGLFNTMKAVKTYGETEYLYANYTSVLTGLSFDPKTYDSGLTVSAAVRKDAAVAKAFADYKRPQTICSGFKGSPDNTVYSCGWTMKDFVAKTELSLAAKLIMGENGEKFKLSPFSLTGTMGIVLHDVPGFGGSRDFLRKIDQSLGKIFFEEIKRGTNDFAVSLNTDGTILACSTTAAMNEWKQITKQLGDHFSKAAKEETGIPPQPMQQMITDVKTDYKDVAGFKISSLKIDVRKLPFESGGFTIKDVKIGVFWAIKGDEAVAGAAGLDYDKAETAFIAALEKTKTPVPLEMPIAFLSMHNAGILLQKSVYPLIEKGTSPEQTVARKMMARMIEVLTAADKKATAEISADITKDKAEAVLRVSGRMVQCISDMIKKSQEGVLDRDEIIDF